MEELHISENGNTVFYLQSVDKATVRNIQFTYMGEFPEEIGLRKKVHVEGYVVAYRNSIEGGKLNWNYSNLGQYKGSWYYVRNGKIDWNCTTLAQVNGKGAWYYVKNGAIDWSYTGLAQVDGKGTYYYVQNGKLNWNANRIWYTSDGTRYDVKNGVATKYVHQHTWKTETETVHYSGELTGYYVAYCKCGERFESSLDLKKHFVYYHNQAKELWDNGDLEKAVEIELAHDQSKLKYEYGPDYDEEVIAYYICTTCGEKNMQIQRKKRKKRKPFMFMFAIVVMNVKQLTN
jgi:hypothetical protein